MVPFSSIDALFSALCDERPGDVVTALAHGLQCAWLLREARPDDHELQLAGLVHDVASSLEPRPPGCHARAGAELVRPLLGTRVALLVGGHVDAKRWLVDEDPEYRTRLSDHSRLTLAHQGDGLDASERVAFASSPHFDDLVLLRRADDAAKRPDALVPPLDAWRPIAELVASGRGK